MKTLDARQLATVWAVGALETRALCSLSGTNTGISGVITGLALGLLFT